MGNQAPGMNSRFRKRRASVVLWLIKKLRTAAIEDRTPEARLFLAIVERGFIDAYVIQEARYRDQARNSYLPGPVFENHMENLGIDYRWAVELVAHANATISVIESEEASYEKVNFVIRSGAIIRADPKRVRGDDGEESRDAGS